MIFYRIIVALQFGQEVSVHLQIISNLLRRDKTPG